MFGALSRLGTGGGYSGGGGKSFETFTIPYQSGVVGILTGADFTLDQREKIYLRDVSPRIYVILFYKQREIINSPNDSDRTVFDGIQKIFMSVGSSENALLKVCNLSIDDNLNNAFSKIDESHPFSWIRAAANRNFYILVYKNGYPQMFYQGPVEVPSLKEFIDNIGVNDPSVKDYYRNIFMKTVSGNEEILKEYRKQAWNDYTQKISGKTFVSSYEKEIVSSLATQAQLPSKTIDYLKTETVQGWPRSFGFNIPTNVEETYKTNAKTWNELFKNKTKSKGKQKGGVKLDSLSDYVSKPGDPPGGAYYNSPYRNFLSTNTKEGNTKDKDGKKKQKSGGLGSLVEQYVSILKELYPLKEYLTRKSGSSNPNEYITKLTMDMLGFYKWRESQPPYKIENETDLKNQFINIGKYDEEIADIVSKNILGKSAKLLNEIFGNDTKDEDKDAILDYIDNQINNEDFQENFSECNITKWGEELSLDDFTGENEYMYEAEDKDRNRFEGLLRKLNATGKDGIPAYKLSLLYKFKLEQNDITSSNNKPFTVDKADSNSCAF